MKTPSFYCLFIIMMFVSTQSVKAEEKIDYTSTFYFQKAMEWFVLNSMDRAVENLEEEVKEHKDNGYAYSMMGYMQCSFALREKAKACRALGKIGL